MCCYSSSKRRTRNRWGKKTKGRKRHIVVDRHFKGNEYEVLYIARHSETTELMKTAYSGEVIWNDEKYI